MKKLIVFASTILLITTACKKDDKQPVNNNGSDTPNYSMPSTTGSYWVYDDYKVDSLGNATLYSSADTVFLLGDSTINGKSYLMYGGDAVGQTLPKFQLDSNGFIMDQWGNILYSYVDLGTVYHTWTSQDFPGPNGSIDLITNEYMMSTQQNITVPAGNYSALVRKTVSYDAAGGPINECGNLEYINTSHFVDGIGMVREEWTFFGAMVSLCQHHYKVLIDYHIEP